MVEVERDAVDNVSCYRRECFVTVESGASEAARGSVEC